MKKLMFFSAYVRLTVKERDGDYTYVPQKVDDELDSRWFREVELINSTNSETRLCHIIQNLPAASGDIDYADVREQIIKSRLCCEKCHQTKFNIDEFLGDKEDKKVTNTISLKCYLAKLPICLFSTKAYGF